MENRINSILVLDNDEKYVVLNQAIYQDRSYFLVAKLTEDETDITGEIKVCEETTIDGIVAIKILKDEKILELVTKYFDQNDVKE